MANVGDVVRRAALAEYSWEELKDLSRAIAAAGSDAEGLGIAGEYGLVDKDGKLRGDAKELVLKDGTHASVRILGFCHDERAGGGKAGISFEFADVPITHSMNPTDNNRGGWASCEMRKWLNGDFFSRLPNDLYPLVETVTKRTNNSGGVGRENDTSVVTARPDKLWLLSMSEVYGALSSQTQDAPWSTSTYDAEGTQYQLYANHDVSIANSGFCQKRGARSWWWLRSACAVDSLRFCYVYGDGEWRNDYADYDWGVSPGFCL